jgi:hypothetical protein
MIPMNGRSAFFIWRIFGRVIDFGAMIYFEDLIDCGPRFSVNEEGAVRSM